jgi:hypothetical protein
LLTYGGLDGRVKVGVAEAAQAIINGSGGVLWWCSVSRNSSHGGGDGRGSSSQQWLGAKDFGVAGRWHDGCLCCDGGEKLSRGRLGAPICRPRSPARAEQRPEYLLQPNQRFLKSSLQICGRFYDEFVGDKTSAWILWLPCEGRKLGIGGGVWGRHERGME